MRGAPGHFLFEHPRAKSEGAAEILKAENKVPAFQLQTFEDKQPNPSAYFVYFPRPQEKDQFAVVFQVPADRARDPQTLHRIYLTLRSTQFGETPAALALIEHNKRKLK